MGIINNNVSYAEQFSQFLEFLRQCETDYSMAQSLQADAGEIGLAEATRLIVAETHDLKKIFKEIKNKVCA